MTKIRQVPLSEEHTAKWGPQNSSFSKYSNSKQVTAVFSTNPPWICDKWEEHCIHYPMPIVPVRNQLFCLAALGFTSWELHMPYHVCMFEGCRQNVSQDLIQWGRLRFQCRNPLHSRTLELLSIIKYTNYWMLIHSHSSGNCCSNKMSIIWMNLHVACMFTFRFHCIMWQLPLGV